MWVELLANSMPARAKCTYHFYFKTVVRFQPVAIVSFHKYFTLKYLETIVVLINLENYILCLKLGTTIYIHYKVQ